MAKLTRNQLALIGSAIYHLDRASNYVMQKDIAIARKGKTATTALHYSRADGDTLYEVTKEIGSDLCGLFDARKQLIALMDQNHKTLIGE